PVTAVISAANRFKMMPSLSVDHTEPSKRKKDAPADSSPPKPMLPSKSPSTNHLKPTGTSTRFLPKNSTTRSLIENDTNVSPTQTHRNAKSARRQLPRHRSQCCHRKAPRQTT